MLDRRGLKRWPPRRKRAGRDLGGGQRFSIRAKGDPGTFFSLIGPLTNRQFARQIQLDVDTLGEVLETA